MLMNHWLTKMNERMWLFYGTMLEIEQDLQFREENGNLVIILGRKAIPGTVVLEVVRGGLGQSHTVNAQGGCEIILVGETGVDSISATYEYARD